MRKKLGSRFPALRIKKIMQADEDVGKIALAVPLLVSKALELFLQDLCDRTYEITLQRGAKTLNSSHLKQCVKTYSAYDFLTGVVNKVPNLGSMEPSEDDKGIGRRRKTLTDRDEAENDVDLQSRAAKIAMRNANAITRERGRGRGRGRPPSRPREERYVKCEDDDIMLDDQDEEVPISSQDPSSTSIANGAATSTAAAETRHDQTLAWPLPDGISNIGVEPSRLVQLTMRIDEDEDYDNED
ncbi:dr1-associated corepressor-like [Zingiber officinale]|uniref:dr1-associated corepressor-like n=1 Tax=Zingiber officinale TaxID=94328 RepID=UPI001C4C8863|nr:dr1-associated corepressor-like [Zingiber officinale]